VWGGVSTWLFPILHRKARCEQVETLQVACIGPLMKEEEEQLKVVRFSGFCCPVISEGLDGQQGLQRNRVAAIAKTSRSNRAGCITNAVRLPHGRRRCFCWCFFLVWHVVLGSATAHSRAISTSISMAVFSRIPSGSPGDHRENAIIRTFPADLRRIEPQWAL
jgi:hypothetical protein